jgi:hypothetical protein
MRVERKAWRCGLTLVLMCLLMGHGVTAGVDGGDESFLRRQVKYLTDALALAKADADGLRARLDGRAVETVSGRGGSPVDPAGMRKKEFRILDVNKELGMVVLDGGRQDGVKPGLQFAVMQEDRAVATVRVVDVRTAVAGAVIQKTGRALPRVQDRAVVVTGFGD